MLLARTDVPRSPSWPSPPPILLPQQVSVCTCRRGSLLLLWMSATVTVSLMLGSSERRHSHSQGSSRSRSPTRRSRAAAPISVPAGAKRHDDRSRSPIRRLAPPRGGCVAQEGGEGTIASNSFVLWLPLLVLSVFYHVPACRSAYSQCERYWSVAAVLGTPNGIR